MRRKLFIFALVAICLVFVSGVAVGVVGRRAFRANRFPSVLVEELDLTPDQRHKIQQIWSKVAENHTPVPMAEIEKAHALYNHIGLGDRDDAKAMQYLIPGWKFDPKRPCLVR